MKAFVSGQGLQVSSSLYIICFVWIFFFAACSQNQNVPRNTPQGRVHPSPQIEYDNQTIPPSHRHRETGNDQEKVREKGSAASNIPSIENKLRNEYSRWLGTKHRLGGNDRNGIDCSGLVQVVYRNAFHIKLPRTTVGQVKQGQPVAFRDMRVGDLVFFKPPDYPRHVGIYLGKNQFVHASKTSGVTISPIDRYYWEPHFWAARRILTD